MYIRSCTHPIKTATNSNSISTKYATRSKSKQWIKGNFAVAFLLHVLPFSPMFRRHLAIAISAPWTTAQLAGNVLILHFASRHTGGMTITSGTYSLPVCTTLPLDSLPSSSTPTPIHPIPYIPCFKFSTHLTSPSFLPWPASCCLHSQYLHPKLNAPLLCLKPQQANCISNCRDTLGWSLPTTRLCHAGMHLFHRLTPRYCYTSPHLCIIQEVQFPPEPSLACCYNVVPGAQIQMSKLHNCVIINNYNILIV